MPKQVPEGPSREKQLEKLRKDMLGHKGFGRLRGELRIRIYDLMKEILSDSKSPTDACRRWDEFVGQVRVMLNALAVYKRDGLNDAAEVLIKALLDDHYFLPGETVPLQETVPVILFVFDPEKTFFMLNYLMQCYPFYGLDRYLNSFDLKRNIVEMVEKLVTIFPSLQNHFQELGKINGPPMDGVSRILTAVSEAYRQHGIKKYYRSEIGAWDKVLESQRHFTFACDMVFVLHADQSEVFRFFSREQQENIASWQFHLPKAIADDNVGYLKYGLHSEHEHNRWKKQHPAFVSSGTSHGMGAIAFMRTNRPNDYMIVDNDFDRFRIIFE